ncbi:hypothetical protein [Duganella sp. Root198D2]|uniref:hypothetical protein n=1 Tax=Duganella sp. Root198D2 TaxID=1736489 RepID=UPI00070C8634|nr:hypothetical protein [Duganella sp. Root198D2]KRB83400.1 hypothetical protein ASE26_13095 [Duganella sp. Root198D2]
MSDANVASPRLVRLGLSGLALLFAVLAVVGGVRGYSPVPFWDMWGGYLPMADPAANGGWSLWWHQHNEHRIVLSRLLFWVDLRWFGGASWFLIAINYILVLLGAVLFCRILREAAAPSGRELDQHALAAFTVASLFFWSQHENLTWAFQSQFILAQLLPLAALYILYRSIRGGSAQFALACLLGVLSAGTMANGILALPMMTVYALLTRQGARRAGVLAALSALLLFAYLHDYASPAGHAALSPLWQRKEQFVRYVAMYLGSPFYFAMGAGRTGKTVALLAGLFLIASSVRFAWQNLRHPHPPALQLALLFFIAYIGATASGTAMGRMHISMAPAFRYTTPALMAWAALLALSAPAFLALHGRRRQFAYGALALLVLPMLAFQLKALESQADEIYDRAVAVLAIELRVPDKVQIGHVYPNTDAIALSAQAADSQRSVFGMYPFRSARAQMGTVFAPAALPVCVGALDSAGLIEGDARFLRVDGWLYEAGRKTVPQVVRFLDAEGKQVGYALGGKRRDDVAATAGQQARSAGYLGYLMAAVHGQDLTLRGEGPAGPICQMQLKAPMALPYRFSTEEPSALRATVGSANVVDAGAWQGGDYAKSSFPGMRVYGSHINSDADRGAIVLRLQRGDRLFYRSGPSGRQQSMEIEGIGSVAMPLAQDWGLLEFSGDALPQQAFTVKLTDSGNGWGEWSAVAIRTDESRAAKQ